jgi:hypothetical protein
MNVWIVFVPGSAGRLLEGVIRFSSALPVHEPDITFSYIRTLKLDSNGNVNSHALPRQWHPTTFAEMQEGKFVGPTETTVYSIISPTEDANGDAIFKWVDENKEPSDRVLYLTARDPVFGLVAQQKVETDTLIKTFSPCEHVTDWDPYAKTFADLKRWQQREYLSGYLDYWFTMIESQCANAKQRGWAVYFAEDIFDDTKTVFRQIFEDLGTTIANPTRFENLCHYWNTNQLGVNLGYKQVTDYIKAIENDDIDKDLPLQSIVYESIIQRYLRVEKNTHLKCFNLNTFPRTIKELKEYYE